MIMPAPFYPGSKQNSDNKKTMNKEEFICALTELGKQRYHSLHPFHKLLHSGKLSFQQVQAWALNRFYYQWSIPRKDLTLMARIDDVDLRLEWRSRVIDHEGDIDGKGGIQRYLQLCEKLNLDSNILQFPVWFFIQIPYVVLMGILSFFTHKISWRGRTL